MNYLLYSVAFMFVFLCAWSIYDCYKTSRQINRILNRIDKRVNDEIKRIEKTIEENTNESNIR